MQMRGVLESLVHGYTLRRVPDDVVRDRSKDMALTQHDMMMLSIRRGVPLRKVVVD